MTATGERRLGLCWLLMAVPALGFALRYPLAGNAGRLEDLGTLADYGVAEFVGYAVGMVALFAGYGLALRQTRRLAARRALPLVFAGGAALALAMVLMYPVNAIDVFIYAVRSRLWTTYGENPSAALPLAYWDRDPFMRLASREWADDTSPYGPLWNLVAAPITWASDDRPFLALLGFKLVAMLAALGCAWAITRTLASSRPDDAATGALFLLWNPLVLWEGIGNAHNDLVVTLLVLLALLAWTRGWDGLVVPLLVAGGLIKYTPLLLVPLAALALWRRTPGARARLLLAAESTAFGLAVLLVAFFPFYDLGAVRESAGRQGQIFLTSPAAIAVTYLAEWAPGVDAQRLVAAVGYGIVAPVLGWQAWRVWRRPARLPRAGFEVLFAFALVATFNFRPWYLIGLVALAALLPAGFPAWRTASWTAGALAAYGLFIWVWGWWGVEFRTIQNLAVALMFAGPIAFTLAELARLRKDEAPPTSTPS